MRDPLQDPQPYDVVQSRQIQLHVHFRKDDKVYFGRWKQEQPMDTVQCSVERWGQECVAHRAEVIQRAEDVAAERAEGGR